MWQTVGFLMVIALAIGLGHQHAVRSSLHAAFSYTAAGLLLLLAGTLGYTLRKSSDGLPSATWSAGIVWWEIWWGLGLSLLAAFFWRKSLRSMR